MLVDFTAAWCINCRVLEAKVLNTPEVRSTVDQHKVAPLRAEIDVSTESETMLHTLDSEAVPVLAIFSPSNPNNPVVFRNGYTKRVLIDALQNAAPTKLGMLEHKPE